MLHLASFAISSFPILMLQIFWRPQVVFVVEPPLFMSPFVLLLSKLTNAISILHVQDFEIDAAFQLGVLKGNVTKKLALKFEGWLMSRFSYVTSISTKMIETINMKGVNSSHTFLFPNWVDLSIFNGSESALSLRAEEYRRSLNIPSEAIVGLYSGSMGLKQGLDILVELAKNTSEITHCNNIIHYVFCGDGPGKEQLIKDCVNLRNVHFLNFQPLADLPGLLSMADIHLLPQRGNVRDLVLPSKLTGMLASGRPILACAHPDTELARLVQDCGIAVHPDSLTALQEGFMTLVNDIDMRNRLGLRGKAYASKNLDRPSILTNFESKLNAMLLGLYE
jgi:colanic acid biosynthesis glycosyl transferase WcaI